MKIAVVGATGRTGSRIVLFALEKGMYVAALVRDPVKFHKVIGRPLTDEEANRLLVIQGNPTNSVDVERAVKEADVVYETVGPWLNNPGEELKRRTAAAIITGMRRAGASRLVSLGSAGTNPNLMAMYSPFTRWLITRFLLDQLYVDLAIANDLFKQEGSWLQYTIVQPPLLVSTAGPTRQYTFSAAKPILKGSRQLPYADLALAMLQVGMEGLYIGQEVGVDCIAPLSAICPVEGAFVQQKEILLDNLQRKVLPSLVWGCSIAAAGLCFRGILYSGKEA